VQYVEGAEYPVFQQVLEYSLPDLEDQKLLRYWSAHCLLPHSRLESCLLCVGNPQSGKSTIVYHGIGSVFRGSCLTGISLKQLCEDGDVLRHLQDSLVNIGTEIDYRLLDDSTKFKILVSGETIYISPKYVSSYALRITTKFCFLANRLPSLQKGSAAELRRMSILYFAKSIPASMKDPSIKYRIEAERDGIFMWLLDVLVDVLQLKEMKQGGELSKAESDLFKVNNNPLGCFVDTCCEFGDSDETFMVRRVFAKAFRNYVKAQGVRLAQHGDDWMWKELYVMHPELRGRKSDRKRIDGELQYVLYGIKLTAEAEQEYLQEEQKLPVR
jgi:phage/plasmid-associated DNA primase